MPDCLSPIIKALEQCFPLRGLKVFGGIVGGDKAEHVSLEALEALEVVVVEGLDGGLLHRVDHPLDLARSRPSTW